MQLSPTAPPRRPRNMSINEGSCSEPAEISSSGVAEASSSTTAGIAPPATSEKARSMNTRPLMAGFAKLCPSPPKRHLTMIIAKAEPTTHCQTGTLELRFSPSRSPVTTALKSPTVCFLCVARSNSASETTAPMTQAAMTLSAPMPKITTAATVAGSSAMTTSSITRRLESEV